MVFGAGGKLLFDKDDRTLRTGGCVPAVWRVLCAACDVLCATRHVLFAVCYVMCAVCLAEAEVPCSMPPFRPPSLSPSRSRSRALSHTQVRPDASVTAAAGCPTRPRGMSRYCFQEWYGGLVAAHDREHQEA